MDGRIVALGIRDLKFRPAPVAEWIVNVPALDLDRGEQMLVTGGVEAGRAALIHLIAGLIDPTEGRIFVGGSDLHALRGARRDLHRGRTIGLLLRAPNLLREFSSIENVMLAMMLSEIPPHEHRAKARQLLNQVGIDRVDSEVSALQLADRKLVALARAMACDPTLVLAEEPTNGLDSEQAAGVMDLLQAICHERRAALLCVHDDPMMGDRFDRAASLDDLADIEFSAETNP